MTPYAKIIKGIISLTFILVIVGCAAGGSTKVVINFDTSPTLNPDPMGRPSPVVIRLYELKSLGVFNNADFFAIYEQDTTILGNDLNAREEIELVPGQHLEFKRELNKETHYLGILAAYRDLDNAVWRASIATPVNKTTNAKVLLDKVSISATIDK